MGSQLMNCPRLPHCRIETDYTVTLSSHLHTAPEIGSACSPSLPALPPSPPRLARKLARDRSVHPNQSLERPDGVIDVVIPPAAVSSDVIGALLPMRHGSKQKATVVGSCPWEIRLARKATCDNVLAAPRHRVAEIINGELHLSPRPAKPHAAATTALGEELGPPFKRGRGGPGGWILLFEPETHLGEDSLVPDLAGWRRERMAVMTTEEPFFRLAPDWVCEVLSPSTSKIDRTRKLPIYARERVGHAWLVDPIDHTLEVLRLDQGRWTILGVFCDNQHVRAEPFDAFELDLAILWADVKLE